MILPLYVNVVTIISKDLNPIFYLFIFSKFNPLNQYYRDYQFLPFFNGENPLLVHGFHQKNSIPEKEQCFPYQKSVK